MSDPARDGGYESRLARQTMRAIVHDKYGSFDVLGVRDIDRPVVKGPSWKLLQDRRLGGGSPILDDFRNWLISAA